MISFNLYLRFTKRDPELNATNLSLKTTISTYGTPTHVGRGTRPGSPGPGPLAGAWAARGAAGAWAGRGRGAAGGGRAGGPAGGTTPGGGARARWGNIGGEARLNIRKSFEIYIFVSLKTIFY